MQKDKSLNWNKFTMRMEKRKETKINQRLGSVYTTQQSMPKTQSQAEVEKNFENQASARGGSAMHTKAFD
jgi:hypothetical protein